MRQVTIFLNEEKTAFKIVKPTEQFNGDWKGLVEGVTNGLFHSYKVN